VELINYDHLTEQDKIYLAAFIDGDGGVYVYPTSPSTRTPGSYYVQVLFCNTNKEVMLWISGVLKEPLEVNRQETLKEKTFYRIRVNGSNAMRLLFRLLPYFKAKKQQAELAIQCHCAFTPAEKEHLRHQIHQLNAKKDMS
jgi:hypothetical protein